MSGVDGHMQLKPLLFCRPQALDPLGPLLPFALMAQLLSVSSACHTDSGFNIKLRLGMLVDLPCSQGRPLCDRWRVSAERTCHVADNAEKTLRDAATHD